MAGFRNIISGSRSPSRSAAVTTAMTPGGGEGLAGFDGLDAGEARGRARRRHGPCRREGDVVDVVAAPVRAPVLEALDPFPRIDTRASPSSEGLASFRGGPPPRREGARPGLRAQDLEAAGLVDDVALADSVLRRGGVDGPPSPPSGPPRRRPSVPPPLDAHGLSGRTDDDHFVAQTVLPLRSRSQIHGPTCRRSRFGPNDIVPFLPVASCPDRAEGRLPSLARHWSSLHRRCRAGLGAHRLVLLAAPPAAAHGRGR